MLMFAMTCLRSDFDNEAVRLIISGRYQEGVQLGMARLERGPASRRIEEHAVLGQVTGRALIHMARTEEAEELFRHQLRSYELESRSCVRWMSSLDQGAMQHAKNRPSRAAQAYGSVADDDTAPTLLRMEALCGVALSVRSLGEYRRARQALQSARDLAREEVPGFAQHVVNGMMLETEVMQQLCVFNEGSDHPFQAAPVIANAEPLSHRLLACADLLHEVPVASWRLKFLAALVDSSDGPVRPIERQLVYINELGRRGLLEAEGESRIEAALAQLPVADWHAVKEVLGALCHDEDTVRKQRQSLELRYCLSHIYAMQGRHADALRVYKDHTAQALTRLHRELSQLPLLRCLERHERLEQTDRAKLLLPLRYRRAYQYIIDNLDNGDLSVREVANHIDVTERALQMAFRAHLGQSPAELIRQRRVEEVRKDLLGSQERITLSSAARRWGVSNRSTLTQNYRQHYKETPSSTLRGAALLPPTSN
jgi:AraC-like DNA-binding protein